MADPKTFDAQRHTLSHLLAVAIGQLWPQTKFGCSFTTDVGFGCDVDLGDTRLTESDLNRIEAQIRRIIDNGQSLVYDGISLAEGADEARTAKQSYWAEVIEAARESSDQLIPLEVAWLGGEDGASTIPAQIQQVKLDGHLVDFCGQPESRVVDASVAYRLIKLSGAYWRGDSDQPQLQRVEGIAFATSTDLDQYLADQTAGRNRDHRYIGVDQELFMGSDLVGAGLPLWLPDGATIRRELENFVIEEELAAGYQHVITPDIAQLDLYEQSGHYSLYRDSMYAPIQIDGRQFILRPMSCPHHFQIYNRRPHSYRELPVRLAEMAKLYRYEQSGELLGLMRLRSFTLADAHIICRPDQVPDEINGVLDLIERIAQILGLIKGQHYSYRLSLHKPGSKKYHDDPAAWQQSEDYLRQAMQSRGEDYIEAVDEAAFYGPKIDVQMISVQGKEETAFTVQYDFLMHKRFNLHYITADNTPADVAVIHRSSIGCIERSLAFLLEHYEGRLPLWLAPRQLRLITVSNSPEQQVLAGRIAAEARRLKLRVGIADGDESLGKRVRQAQADLVACQLVIGDKEVKTGQVAPQWRSDLVDDVRPVSSQPQSPKSILASLHHTVQHRSLKILEPNDE